MPTEELFGNYNFLLEVSAITGDSKLIIAGFKELSGTEGPPEPEPTPSALSRVPGYGFFFPRTGEVRPASRGYVDVLLTNGYTVHRGEFEAWRLGPKRQGSVIILDRDGETEIGRYNFVEGGLSEFQGEEAAEVGTVSGYRIDRLKITFARLERG